MSGFVPRRGRGDPALRCERCNLHHALCICAQLPTFPTQTRIILLIHQLEARKPSNTGRLALACLPNSAIFVRGRLDRDVVATTPGIARAQENGDTETPAWLTEAPRPVLLFPHHDAQPIESFIEGPPVTLVVPDGSWRQASNSRIRVPGLDQIPCAALPTLPPSEYRLRCTDIPGRGSTLEAIAAAVSRLEGQPEIDTQLRLVLRWFVDRRLQMGGRGAQIANEPPENTPS